MRIGVDISQIVFPGTGTTRYTTELLQALMTQYHDDSYTLFGASLRRRGDFATICEAFPKKAKLVTAPIPPTLLNILWNNLHIVPIDLFIGAQDVVHTSDATQPPSKRPTITTIHDLVAYRYPETLHPTQVLVQKNRLAWVKKEAVAVIAVSQATKNDLIEYLAIAPEKITVTYEGVASRFHANLKSETLACQRVREKYHLPETYLFSLGTMQPRKNIPFLLKAFQAVTDAPTLVLAGSYGWGKTTPPVKNALILGFVDDNDLPYLYAQSSGFMYPSLYEGFGLPVLEALACGVPTITSNVSSLPEVGGEAAFYCDPTNLESLVAQLKRLIALSTVDYDKTVQASLAQAQKFRWETVAQQTHAVYQSVLKGSIPHDHRI